MKNYIGVDLGKHGKQSSYFVIKRKQDTRFKVSARINK